MSLIERKVGREVKFTIGVNPYSAGSVISEFGATKVHITASLEDRVPPFLRGGGSGWITAEYSMLPGSTHTRSRRERDKVKGRTYEIQRLIGRSLRSVVDLDILGERSIVVDCDVLVADGGTRTASVSGAFVALRLAINGLIASGELEQDPIKEALAAVSVGINSDGRVIADLDYQEDSSCQTDMNIVMTENGHFVEIQGTAEGAPFSPEQLTAMLECSKMALAPVFIAQKQVLQ
ncbi:MAG: ribonuclease PH [Bdellovibrionales bacterium]|nr:ribonuclease PH [Bdellovibrionales bacterium]MBT3525689.1 ribonuclease PH [Bdellovibrionales bacterium]